MGGNRAGAQRFGSPVPIPLPKARALNLLLLRLAVLGLAQVSGLWPPGSGLQEASENLWLEKVLASPIPASPPFNLAWFIKILCSPPPSPPPPAAAASLPWPFVSGQGNPLQLPPPCLLTLPTSVEPTAQPQTADKIPSLFPLVLAMNAEEGVRV